MTARHAKPIVVRLWKTAVPTLHAAAICAPEPINALVDDWDNGTFSLPEDHPMAAELRENIRHTAYVLTVLSTDELEWHPHTATWDRRWDKRIQIQCHPRLQMLRNQLLIGDEWLIERGMVS